MWNPEVTVKCFVLLFLVFHHSHLSTQEPELGASGLCGQHLPFRAIFSSLDDFLPQGILLLFLFVCLLVLFETRSHLASNLSLPNTEITGMCRNVWLLSADRKRPTSRRRKRGPRSLDSCLNQQCSLQATCLIQLGLSKGGESQRSCCVLELRAGQRQRLR